MNHAIENERQEAANDLRSHEGDEYSSVVMHWGALRGTAFLLNLPLGETQHYAKLVDFLTEYRDEVYETCANVVAAYKLAGRAGVDFLTQLPTTDPLQHSAVEAKQRLESDGYLAPPAALPSSDALSDSANHCIECSVDLGEINPRQLCGKTQCVDMGFKRFLQKQ